MMVETKEIDDKEALDPEVIVEETPKRVVAADEGIEGLKKQLLEEKTLREAAQRQVQEAAAQVHKAQSELQDNELTLVTNALETTKSHAEALESAYANAISKNDGPLAGKLQREIAKAEARILQLETGRQAMVERPKTPPPVVPVADPVEALANRLTPRSAAWVRAHPEYATGELYEQMVNAHRLATSKRIKSDSDEYFRAVERFLDIEKPPAQDDADEDGTEQAARVVSRRSSPAAAPVSRSAPSSTGNPRVIRLNAEEREMARLNKMTDQEYWEQKQRISRDTRYN